MLIISHNFSFKVATLSFCTQYLVLQYIRQNGGHNFEKQAKNRNETGSNLSLGTRLTRVKRLSHKRCCDTTPDRCQEGSRLTILFRIL